MATRWGICGAGKISSDFCLCLKSLPENEHQIAAVAARDKERAEQFASEFDVLTTYGSYDELAQDPTIDVVYIGTIHISHVELSLMFINAGKNVLCEKPMALSLAGCQKVLKAAKEKGVLFVEGIWSRFFPVYKFIKEHIESGAIGDPIIVEASFTQTIKDIPRIKDVSLGGGGLMDLGIYPIQAANLIFKGRPERIVADGCKMESGADETGVIQLRYPGNKFVNLTYSTNCSNGANSMTVRGTKGNIAIPDHFWCPNRVVLQNNEVKYFQLPEVEDADAFCCVHSEGFCYEAQCIRECILSGAKECPQVTHEDSETIMYIMSEVLKQLGVQYKYE